MDRATRVRAGGVWKRFSYPRDGRVGGGELEVEVCGDGCDVMLQVDDLARKRRLKYDVMDPIH